jgi:SAM-dependent methyltransferase
MTEQLPLRGGRLARWPKLKRMITWMRWLFNPTLRQIHRLRTERPGEVLQPYPFTCFDRHPTLFGYARDQLGALDKPRILSFGCSTGEEPLSLALYLPSAQINAVDINPHSIAIARKLIGRQGTANIDIELAATPPDHPEYYDAVFCLSVLRHGDLDANRPLDCSRVLPFARFAQTVGMLDRVLRPGGLLFIWGSNFRFSDLLIAESYEVMSVPGSRPHRGAVYGPDNRLLPQNGNSQFVYRKRLSG